MRRPLVNIPPSLSLYWGAIARVGVSIAGLTREAVGDLALVTAETERSTAFTPCKASLALSHIRSTRIRSFDSYWRSVCGDRDFPAKHDIDPTEIKSILPYVKIAEIHEHPLRIRYRLVGTELCRVYNENYTGKWLHETLWGPLISQYEKIYQKVLARRMPIFGIGQIEWAGRIMTYEWGKWPLSEDGVTIAYCVGMEDYVQIPSSDPIMLSPRYTDRQEP